MKIHIFGASGSGTTTIGRALANQHKLLHLDSDDFYWQNTDPPYIKTNAIEERWRLINCELNGVEDWLLSGSIDSWSEPYINQFDLVIYLDVPTDIRVARLRIRESNDFGERILPGGDMYDSYEEFIGFAIQYDEGYLPGRNRERHEQWMKRLSCPLLNIVGEPTIEEAVNMISQQLQSLSINNPT